MTAKYVQYGSLRYKILRFKDGRIRLEIVKRGILDIAEIIGLNEQIELNELDLSSNKIKNINGLENLVDLRILRLSSNQISEINGLERLVKLEELYLDENQIKEINGLENLTNLRVLDLTNNEITDDQALDELKNKIPSLDSIQIKGNPCAPGEKAPQSINRSAFLSKLDCSEFFDGEAFKSNPEGYMKNRYGEVRKRVKKLYGAEKLKEMEKYIIEKFCFYEDEQILYECEGKIKLTEQFEQKPSGKYKMDHTPINISVSSGNLFFTNYRIIAQGKVKVSGGHSTSLFSSLFPLLRRHAWTGTTTRAKRRKDTFKSSPIYGYHFPIRNRYRLGKINLIHSIWYSVKIDKQLCTIFIKPSNTSKREEQMNKIFDLLRSDVNEVLDAINELYETEIGKNKRRAVLGFLKILRKLEGYTHLSDSDFLNIVKETYKLDPEFFMNSIYPKMKSWGFPSFINVKGELIELIENLDKETG